MKSIKNAEAVVIGASAGAVEALSTLLPMLPADYKLPIVVVVHLPPDKDSIISELFQAKCHMKVKEAEDKEELKPGTIYFAPPNYHLLVEDTKHFSLSNEEPLNYSRPSIDVLFESSADAFEDHLVGIILTGANHDGAAGLKSIYEAGGVAIAQCPCKAYASAMPQAALDQCPDAESLPLDKIGNYLLGVTE